jgi:hypothetical protein
MSDPGAIATPSPELPALDASDLAALRQVNCRWPTSGARRLLPVPLRSGSRAIVLLMVTVRLSYRQTVRAYRNGGGSYIVTSANLGHVRGLIAAAGLMTDSVSSFPPRPFTFTADSALATGAADTRG